MLVLSIALAMREDHSVITMKLEAIQHFSSSHLLKVQTHLRSTSSIKVQEVLNISNHLLLVEVIWKLNLKKFLKILKVSNIGRDTHRELAKMLLARSTCLQSNMVLIKWSRQLHATSLHFPLLSFLLLCYSSWFAVALTSSMRKLSRKLSPLKHRSRDQLHQLKKQRQRLWLTNLPIKETKPIKLNEPVFFIIKKILRGVLGFWGFGVLSWLP